MEKGLIFIQFRINKKHPKERKSTVQKGKSRVHWGLLWYSFLVKIELVLRGCSKSPQLIRNEDQDVNRTRICGAKKLTFLKNNILNVGRKTRQLEV
jgi:hypothetical protein